MFEPITIRSMNQLYQSNLLFVTFFFCVGLILGVEPSPILWAFSITLACCSFMTMIAGVFSTRHHLFFASTFLLFGMILMHSSFPLQNQQIEFDEETFCIAKIDEQLKKGAEWETNLITVEQVWVDGRWKSVKEKVLMLTETSTELMKEGDRVLVKSRFNFIQNNGNPGEFNAENYWKSKGVRYQCFGFSENVRLIEQCESNFITEIIDAVRRYSIKMIETFVSKDAQGLAQAILLGDKSNLDIETKNSFANAGAVHVLAVSGLHVGIIAYLLNFIFQFIFKGNKRNVGIVLIVIILWLYALITGFSPSVTRAVLMFSILIGAQLFSRNYHPINSLAFAAFILLIWNPLYLFDPGFQLSFLAMLGIFLVYSQLESLMYIKQPILKKVWQGTAVGLSAQLLTFPLSLYLFFQFPNYFVLSNLGVMLLANIILAGGIALVTFGAIPFVNTGIGWILSVAVVGLIMIVDWVQSIPGSVAQGFQPSIIWTIGIYGLIVYFIIGSKKRIHQIIGLTTFLALVLFIQFDRYENLTRNEMCVFNTNHPTILFNHEGEQICLYTGDDVGLKKAEQLVSNYQRIHPGVIQYINLGSNQVTLENEELQVSVKRNRYYVDVNYKSKYFRILTSAKYWLRKEELDQRAIICAPYMSHQKGLLHHLKSGAFHCSLGTF